MASSSSGLSTTFTLYRIPLSTILEWPPMNTTNPETRLWYIPYAAVFTALSTVIVATRLWTRFGMRGGGLGTDDTLIVFGWFFACAHTGTGIYGVTRAGMSRHVWDITKDQAVLSGLVGFIDTMFFLASMTCIKCSVLLFFLRLVDRRVFCGVYYAVIVGVIFTILWFLAFLFVLIFACNPVRAAYMGMDWTWPEHYSCTAREPSDLMNGVFSILTDVYAIVLPALIVRGLHISRTRRLILYGVFGCGLMVIGASIARTVVGKRIYYADRGDLTWYGHDLLVWSTLELHLALICASAPAMKGFFSRIGEAVSQGSRNRSVQGPNSSPWATGDRGVVSQGGESVTTMKRSYMMQVSRSRPEFETDSLEALREENFTKWYSQERPS